MILSVVLTDDLHLLYLGTFGNNSHHERRSVNKDMLHVPGTQ
jgi:hypothetical protein